MPESNPDPRVYFAAERTLLAWVRTGIGVMAFGFVVARFALFLQLLQARSGTVATHGLSTWLGAALVMAGVLATVAGGVQFHRFCRRLLPEELPGDRTHLFPIALAVILAGVGVVLAVILVT
ncbi:MAG TPA: DUF202 domain-containing protein [Vicinamibacterales bacterium]|nr:DUF202 domain-containing protein [Vicinamibacterales bacterium]